MLVDKGLARGFVIDRQGYQHRAIVSDLVQGALEGAELSVAVRAPGSAVDENHTEVAGQIVRQEKSAATDPSDGE
jgi:hypothetical protein